MAKKKTTTKPAKKTKTAKAKKGDIYRCEVCGCEIVCLTDGTGAVVCCEEPMCVVC